MFDIGTMELLVIAVVAIVVVGPRELPRVLKGFAQVMRTLRNMTAEFRAGVETLAAEVEREADPFGDLKKKEGITAGMTAEEITEKIMANRAADQSAEQANQPAQTSSAPGDQTDPKPDGEAAKP